MEDPSSVENVSEISDQKQSKVYAINTNPSDEKLKHIVKQLYQDKQELKKALEEEINSHMSDVNELKNDLNETKLKYQKLLEESSVKNENKLSSEQKLKYKEMEEKIRSQNSTIVQLKVDVNDLNLQNQVLRKQVEQYKATISSLEEDATHAASDKHQLAVAKNKISELEDDVRSKSRQIKELETSYKWIDHELVKAKNKLAQATSKSSSCSIQKYDIFDLNSSNESVLLELNLLMKKMNFTGSHSKFLTEVHENFKRINEENNNLLSQIKLYKTKLSMVKGQQLKDNATLPPDKMKLLVKKLVEHNKDKVNKLKALSEICKRQHSILANVYEENKTYTLRNLIKDLASCPEKQREAIHQNVLKRLELIVGKPSKTT